MRSIALPATAAGFRRPPARKLLRDILREWRRRNRSRGELARMDERMLRDIGVSQADAWRESNKPFWRG